MFEVWFFDDGCHELETTFTTREEAEEYAEFLNNTATNSSEEYYEAFPQGYMH